VITISENLKKLGLTDYESKSYIALVSYGPMKGREVAEKSGVPPTRVFDSLKSLIEKGFVTMVSHNPMIFKAIDVDVAVKNFVNRKIENLSELQSSTINSLRDLQKPKILDRIHERITVVSGYDKMFELANQLTRSSKKELLILSVGEQVPASQKKVLKQASKSGVKILFIAQKYDNENIHILKEFKSFGLEIRYYPSKDYSIVVSDRKNAIITIKHPKNPQDRIAIWFDNEELSNALADYFYSIWKKAKIVKF